MANDNQCVSLCLWLTYLFVVITFIAICELHIIIYTYNVESSLSVAVIDEKVYSIKRNMNDRLKMYARIVEVGWSICNAKQYSCINYTCVQSISCVLLVRTQYSAVFLHQLHVCTVHIMCVVSPHTIQWTPLD